MRVEVRTAEIRETSQGWVLFVMYRCACEAAWLPPSHLWAWLT